MGHRGRVRQLSLAAALRWIGPALAGAEVPRQRTDAELGSAVFDAVLGYPQYGVFDSVGFRVEAGTVTLQGSVNQPWRKQDIERRVAELDGVREVKNEIRVQPVSSFDDGLRLQLYQRIYGDSLFERFAGLAAPPIRIIVENGRVTLTGIVGSRLEKTKLDAIARGTLSFGVSNQVQVESERTPPTT